MQCELRRKGLKYQAIRRYFRIRTYSAGFDLVLLGLLQYMVAEVYG